MIKRLFLMMGLAIIFVAYAGPVHAQGIGEVYVDIAWTGSEDGTQSKPYNTPEEGIRLARSMPNGGYVYIKSADGKNWGTGKYYAPITSGAMGTPLTSVVLYSLLAILAVGLMIFGWKIQRRSHRLQS